MFAIHPGIRAAVTRPGPVDIIKSVLGAGHILDYRAGSYTPGTGADVAAAPNKANGTGYADVSQGTDSRRPHAATVLTYPAWTMAAANDQHLTNATLSPALAAVGDHLTVWVVAQLDSWTSTYIFSLFNSGYTEAFRVRALSSTIRGVANTQSAGQLTPSAAFTDTGLHIFRLTLDSAGATIAADGAETTSAATTGGLSFEPTVIRVGNDSFSDDLSVFRVVGGLNISAAQITSVEAILAAEYGVTL